MAVLGARTLDWAEAKASTDGVKRGLELTCSRCGEHVCDIEAGDTLQVLVSVFEDHICGAES